MKDKLFVAAIAALAMTACTSEEDLQVNPSGKVSPIQFTVSLDDEALTRAEFGGNNEYTLNWTNGDQMSLFHGMNLGTVSDATSLTGAQNAIYKAASGSSESSLVFTTQSMVRPGDAIMVYPCDSIFQYDDDGKLMVRIPEVQNDENIKGKIPFISEGLKIKDFEEGKINGGGAGYARNYNIKLKQVATLYTLNTTYSGTEYDKIKALSDAGDIEPILTQKVALHIKDGFNKALEVKVKPVANGSNWNVVDEQNIWENESFVDYSAETIAKVNELVYEYTPNSMKAAEFMLLPQKAYTADEEGNSEYITVDTYYGQVKIAANTPNIMTNRKGEKIGEKGNIQEAFKAVIDYTTKTPNSSTSTFYGEEVGAHVTQTALVDLQTLDMSKVHIKSDKQLHDILVVYKALGFTNPVNLTIDGDATHRFFLSMNNVRTLQSEGYENVKLLACNTASEKCSEIVLTGNNESEDVPSINFLISRNVNIVLGADYTWTWKNGIVISDLVETLTNEGILNLDNGDIIWDAHSTVPAMVNNGTINVTGLVKQQMEMTNNGTITIAEGGEYRADNTTITNEATSATVMGEIYNSGIFATSNSGIINNYGLIKNMEGGVNNMTYITTNQTTGVSFASKWSSTNKYGTIELKNADDNISVSNATNVGFIKYEYTEEEYVTPAICKYNYIVITNHNIKFTAAAPEIKFIEIVGEITIPVFTNPMLEPFVTLDGFILKGKANLQENNKLVTPAAYIDGTLYYGGLFKKPGGKDDVQTENTYYGNSAPNCLVKF